MKNLLYILITLFIIVSCRKESDLIVITEPTTEEPVFLVKATVEGQIIDEEGNALSDVIVKLQDYTAKSRFDGRFTFLDVNIHNNKQTIKINHEGYYRASRNFKPVAGQQTELAVRMLKKDLVSSFESSSAKQLEGNDGYKLSFPSNAIKYKDGNLYNGNVNVYAKWMDPTTEETFQTMPGDLTGITLSGEETGLITYGMLNIELESDNGDALDIADGSEVELRFPVPDKILNNAPSTIPLWYFDESSNRWIEEGFANLIDQEYVGNVSHFTVWNCDAPIEVIDLSGIINLTNERESNVKIKLTSQVTNFEFFTCSSANGSFVIPAALGEELLLEIFNHCDLIHSTLIGPFDEDTVLGTIDTESINGISFNTVTGIIQDCNGVPITGASVHLVEQQSSAALNSTFSEADGSFSITTDNCTSTNHQITAYDIEGQKVNSSELFEFENGMFEFADPLEICNDFVGWNLVEIFFDGQSYHSQPTLLWGDFDYIAIPAGTDSTKYVITLSVLDWISGNIQEYTTLYKDYEDVNPQTLEFDQFGFTAVGNATFNLDISDPDKSTLWFSFSSDEIIVNEPNLFPGVEEVIFNFIRN